MDFNPNNTRKKLENVENFLNNTKDRLFNTFGINPLTTSLGIKIDIATSPEIVEDNWSKYLEICDIINETPEGPKDASRAIRRKLCISAGKYNNSIIHTLNLLDSCVKNCGHRFHVYIATREFSRDLIKILNPKFNPSFAIQQRILALIQSWARAFTDFPDLQGVVQMEIELKSKGIEVPLADTGCIYSVQKTSIDNYNQSINNLGEACTHLVGNSNQIVPLGANQLAGHILGDKNSSKLQSELEIVKTNIQVLGDILNDKLTSNVNGSICHEEDVDLVKKLYSICKDMQGRIIELLNKVANESILTDLLSINDELNQLFLKYQQFESTCITDPCKTKESDPFQHTNIFVEDSITSCNDIIILTNRRKTPSYTEHTRRQSGFRNIEESLLPVLIKFCRWI
ncbi:TOM1-like protein 2 isoform X2 [Gordionus sp. m RMFG-2023]|uniref:TOM1-like protein 2 isoform X2 n=1 Tax=Gordionus sp. m RMFG-2023 TaxID=3053472 RepID=UPI0031FDD730